MSSAILVMIERQIHIDPNNYRVAPGFGIRLNIPALGPAPLAIDFAVPVHRASTDQIQNVSFFMGLQALVRRSCEHPICKYESRG